LNPRSFDLLRSAQSQNRTARTIAECLDSSRHSIVRVRLDKGHGEYHLATYFEAYFTSPQQNTALNPTAASDAT
jgi:hypothetical protein